jgi:Uma2 family endonuclease
METDILAPPQEKHLWTYGEMLEKLPETNQPTELWNGELIVSAAPNPNHQTLVGNIWSKINDFAREKNLGRAYPSPVDVVLSSHRVVQPDVLFVSKENAGIVQDRIRGVPDLTVEVISEGSWRRDRIDKKELYAQFGVKEYWIVDPEARTLEIFALTEEGYKLHARGTEDDQVKSKLLPGLSISFREVEL